MRNRSEKDQFPILTRTKKQAGTHRQPGRAPAIPRSHLVVPHIQLTPTSGARNCSMGRLHLREAELSRERCLCRPSQGMCELNEPTANTAPKTVLAEGQAVLQDLKQQQEAALHLPRPCQSCSHTCRSIPPLGISSGEGDPNAPNPSPAAQGSALDRLQMISPARELLQVPVGAPGLAHLARGSAEESSTGLWNPMAHVAVAASGPSPRWDFPGSARCRCHFSMCHCSTAGILSER